MDVVRVVLVDDHEVVRLGLITLLEDVAWVEVVGEAGTAAEAITAVSTHRPDIVVMDIRMPGESGVHACREIRERWPGTQVIILTSYADDNLIIQALQADACGYVLKQVGNQSLIEALSAVQRGEALFDPTATKQAIHNFRQQERVQHGDIFKELTEREIAVLAQIAEGRSNPQIAANLSVSEQTVCNDINSILTTLGVSNRFAAAIYAIRHNINYYLPERDE